jgi:tetratricopeptide (TPR) repeat protein
LLASRIEEAGTVSERALDFSRKYKERANEAWALRLLGEIAVHRGPHFAKEAQTRFDQALTLANELGMRPLVAHCHHGLGRLYRRKKKREQAQEHLTTATTMYRDMGMTYWLEKAEAEMREVG